MERIWWERIPNALAFISDIVNSLLGEKSVVLHYASEIPWYDSMISLVRDSVKQQSSSKRFESLTDVENPGAYLLKECCKPEKRAQYRPTKSYAKFFAESDDIVLHQRYFWIKVDSRKSLDAWMDFVEDYLKCRPKGKEIAVFILEWSDHKLIKAKKGIKVISFDNYIDSYDRILFAMLASSTVSVGQFIKTYLSELTANIIGNDVELCAECLQNYQSFLKDPYKAIEEVLQTSVRSDGQAFVYNREADEIKHNIWRARIKTIYPVLEEYREDFVKKYRDVIQKELPITSSYGQQYIDPEDVELGTLVYMAGSGRIRLTTREYDKLSNYKEARNKLSHLSVLSIEEIEGLIS